MPTARRQKFAVRKKLCTLSTPTKPSSSLSDMLFWGPTIGVLSRAWLQCC